MALFIVMIVAMGIKMVTSGQSKYEDNYYELGESHTKRMELEKVGERVSVFFNAGNLTFNFDSIGFVKEIKLIYLANPQEDRIIRLKDLDPSKEKQITLDAMKPGIWYLEASGFVNGQEYFKKKKFVK